MSYTLEENAHAVLLPAFGSTRLSDGVRQFLSNGGCAILPGQTRQEYVARQMSLRRRQEETAKTLADLTGKAAALSGRILVAVDQEIAGICRLHDLVPPFPSKQEITEMSSSEFEAIASDVASAAKEMGVNCFLAPVLDIVTGDNPWLQRRTWSTDPGLITQISSAYIRGIQAKGVAAAAKHFPGYSHIALDPAISSEALVTAPLSSFETCFIPFDDAVKNGVEIVMTGPAVVEAFDPDNAASVSPPVIRILRERFGFRGIVMSDDLDAPATLRGNTVTQAAVDALNAGSDLLLIADLDDHVTQVVLAVVNAVKRGDLAESRLAGAAMKVRALAARYS